MGRVSRGGSNRAGSEKKLQAHPVQLLLLEQVRPTNLQQGWNPTDLVCQPNLATHDYPRGDRAAAHHADAASRDILRFSVQQFLGLFGGFEGLKEN